MRTWRAYQAANRPRCNNADLYIMWLLIVIIAVLLYSFSPAAAPPPVIVPRLICIRCHFPEPLPVVKSVGQYRRIKQGKPKTADDMRAVRELKLLDELLAANQEDTK